MAKPFSYAFYHSKAWERAREDALKRDAYLCQRCFAAGDITPAVMVHHIEELTPANINDPDITCGLDNLISLCDRCHKITHGCSSGGAPRQGVCFFAVGILICLAE